MALAARRKTVLQKCATRHIANIAEIQRFANCVVSLSRLSLMYVTDQATHWASDTYFAGGQRFWVCTAMKDVPVPPSHEIWK